MTEAGYGAEEQASRRARRVARLREDAARGEAVDSDVLRRAQQAQRNWSVGAEGERLVAANLAYLERYGWTALHDVRWPGRQQANIDHIAVGPGGVIVIDAKNWSGDVRVTTGAVRQNGYGRAAALEGASQAAAAVTALLEPQHRSAVRGVMCLAGQEDQPVTVVGGVTVCGRWALPEHLLTMPARLNAYEVADIARHLGAELDRSARVPARSRGRTRPVTSASARQRSKPSDRRPARRTRRRAVVGEALIGVLGLVAVYLLVMQVMLPRLIASVGG